MFGDGRSWSDPKILGAGCEEPTLVKGCITSSEVGFSRYKFLEPMVADPRFSVFKVLLTVHFCQQSELGLHGCRATRPCGFVLDLTE